MLLAKGDKLVAAGYWLILAKGDKLVEGVCWLLLAKGAAMPEPALRRDAALHPPLLELREGGAAAAPRRLSGCGKLSAMPCSWDKVEEKQGRRPGSSCRQARMR